MRRRTITLVVVGLVLALFVLPAAAQALLGDEPAAEETAEQEVPYLSYGYDEDSHVVFYGIEDDSDAEPLLDCVIPEGVELEVTIDPDTGEITYEVVAGDYEVPTGCLPVLIEGPNGQVNHGQFVSNMLHALKDGYDKDVHGPFGQWVKEFAHDDEIGKGDLKVKANDDDLAAAELAEVDDDDDDGDGPPDHANANSKKPKKNK